MRRFMGGLVRFVRDFALGVHTANGIRHGVTREGSREQALASAESEGMWMLRGGPVDAGRAARSPEPVASRG
ncbi:hypothetical protein ACPESR_08340 [Nocardia testacea]|uniref:hypothetical protein n=1 Tax=Nocardia testacea TaxID=248551 RepID=UPI003C2B71AB